MKLFSALLLLLVITAASLFSVAEKHVSFQANPDKIEIKSGEEFKVKLAMDLKYPWYTYALKDQIGAEGIGPTTTEILVSPEESIELLPDMTLPKTKKKFDEGFLFELEYYKDQVDFVLPLKAKKDINLASDSLFVLVYLQLCDTVRCLPPEELKIYITPEVIEISEIPVEDEKTEIKSKPMQTESQKDIDEAKGKGIFSFLWFAMTAGALALLTPCVFPMIPITVSFFTKRAEKTGGRGLKDASIYSLGIIFTFTAIGFVLALLLGPTGIRDFAANGWVNLFIAAIFIVFAYNLFGAFEIQIPTGLLNKLNAKSQSGTGITSVLLMGLTFSLTSFTCTVPFVGSALISAADGEWFYPIIGMLGFSVVFAAPFFFLALFPSMLNKMPSSGGWMNNVKVVMGFLEIAAAIKFISNADLVWSWGIMPREMFISIWIICGLLIVIYILGLFKLKFDSPIDSLGAIRLTFAIFFGTVTIYLFTGLMDKPLGEIDAFLPPADYDMIMGSTATSTGISNLAVATKGKGDKHEWLDNYEQGLRIAREEGKNVFIDFTGFTCTNCRQMEAKVLAKADISAMLDQYVLVRLYTDRNEEPYLSNKKLQQDKFGSIELPLYVIITPDEEMIATNTFTRDIDQFREFLQKGFK